MLELFIVRHGESIRNQACLLAHQGSGTELKGLLAEAMKEDEWPLTETGRNQAAAAGKWLAEKAGPIEALYCSPYERAKETAESLHLGVSPIIDSRLREREWGDIKQGDYSVNDYLTDLKLCADFDWRSRFPGAESIHDLVPATSSFVEDLRAKYSQGQIVIVTHGGRMQAFAHLLEGEDVKRRYTNCCVLQYKFEADDMSVRIDYPAQPELSPVPWQKVCFPVTIG